MQKSNVKTLKLCISRAKGLIPDVKYILRRPFDEISMALPVIYSEISTLLKLESEASSKTLANLHIRATEKVSKRPGYPKLMRLHQAYKALSNRLLASPVIQSKVNIDSSKVLESSFLPLTPITTFIMKRFIIKRPLMIIQRIIISRLM
jgi:hypothetical protein